MAIAQHIQRRGGIYHLRVRVPSCLVPVVGKGELHRSLGTAHPKEAKWRGHRLYGMILEIFDGLSRMAETKEEWLFQLAAMSDSEREKTIGDLFDLASASVQELGREKGRRKQAETDVHKLPDLKNLRSYTTKTFQRIATESPLSISTMRESGAPKRPAAIGRSRTDICTEAI